jgi:hypothetical protein
VFYAAAGILTASIRRRSHGIIAVSIGPQGPSRPLPFCQRTHT